MSNAGGTMLEYRDAVVAVRAVAAARGVSDSDGVRAIARALLQANAWPADAVGMTAYLDIEFDYLAPVEGAASTDTSERLDKAGCAPPPSPSPVTLQSALRALAGALDEAEGLFGDTRVADRLTGSAATRLAGNRDADEALASVLFEICEGAPVWTSLAINGHGLLR